MVNWPAGMLGYCPMPVLAKLIPHCWKNSPNVNCTGSSELKVTVAALLFAISLTVIVFGDQWGDTRYSAPLLGAVLIAGLDMRSRRAQLICALAAGMTLFLPAAIVGT